MVACLFDCFVILRYHDSHLMVLLLGVLCVWDLASVVDPVPGVFPVAIFECTLLLVVNLLLTIFYIFVNEKAYSSMPDCIFSKCSQTYSNTPITVFT